MTDGAQERAAFADALAVLGAALGAVIGLMLIIGTRNSAMAFHGALFVAAGVLAAVFILKKSFEA